MTDIFKPDESTQKSLFIFYGVFIIFILITLIYNYFYADKHIKKEILNEKYVRIVIVFISTEKNIIFYM